VWKQQKWAMYHQSFMNSSKSSTLSGKMLLLPDMTLFCNFTLTRHSSVCISNLDHFRCLIFVDRKITARVIERAMKKFSQLSHFTVSFLTGGSSSVGALTPKVQKDTLDSFRSGKVVKICLYVEKHIDLMI
jgi:ERCC4-related helicase